MDDEALLDLILSKGRRTQASRKAVKALLAEWPTLAELHDATTEGIMRVTGLPAGAVELLKAAVELGKRTEAQQVSRYRTDWKFSDRSVTLQYVDWKFQQLKFASQEEFHVITVNSKGYPIATHMVTKGLLRNCLVHPREVFKPAFLDHANTILCVHNHPSGVSTPSEQDIAMTRRLMEAGNLLGIDVMDHIVVSRGGCCPVLEFP